MTIETPNQQAMASREGEFLEHLRMQQNLPAALVAAVLGAIAGSVVWAAVSYVANMHIGYVAIAVAFIVGFSIRTLGKGLTPVYGVIGAVATLVSCFFGEVSAAVLSVAHTSDSNFISVLGQIDYGQLISSIVVNTGPISWFIYALGVYLGYNNSIRKVTPEELARLGV